MTTTVPRRMFNDIPDDEFQQSSHREVDLKANGMIRANGIIPIEYNERLKAMARKQGKNADQLIGELLLEMRPTLDEWEAKQEVVRLQERFGDNWMELLRSAAREGSHPLSPLD